MKNVLLILSVILLFFSSVVAAQTIQGQIILSKAQFAMTDQVFFEYTLSSEQTMNVKFQVGITCPGLLQPLFVEKETTLTPAQPYNDRFEYGVPKQINPTGMITQTCVAQLKIIEPKESIPLGITDSATYQQQFQIVGNKNSVATSAIAQICTDEKCDQSTTTFLPDQTVFIQNELATEAILTTPDGKQEMITLPYQFQPKQTGTYALQIQTPGTTTAARYFSVSPKVTFQDRLLGTGTFAQKNIFKRVVMSATPNRTYQILGLLLAIIGAIAVLIISILNIKKRAKDEKEDY